MLAYTLLLIGVVPYYILAIFQDFTNGRLSEEEELTLALRLSRDAAIGDEASFFRLSQLPNVFNATVLRPAASQIYPIRICKWNLLMKKIIEMSFGPIRFFPFPLLCTYRTVCLPIQYLDPLGYCIFCIYVRVPDPVRSGPFGRIRIRKFSTGSVV